MLGTREPPPSRASLVLGLYGALALTAVLVSAGRGDADIFRIDESRAPWWHLVSAALGLALALGVVVASRAAATRLAWARTLHRDFRAILGELPPREIFILAAASAIGEELVFRGALLPWVGLVPQAILFAVLHIGPNRRHLVWTAWALAMGLAFGALALFTGDLLGAVVAHFAINFINLHYIVRVEDPGRRAAVLAVGVEPMRVLGHAAVGGLAPGQVGSSASSPDAGRP
ncbi:MAG: CPBP family intramembrane metalloprotease [Myxococcales bacterium]|nr:CPBP family intramembrane metalloprotease [Myxococcales bacterium]